jgi:SAM-dependent methyltransferase
MKPPMTVHGWLRYDVVRRLLPHRATSVLEIGAGIGAVGSLLAPRRRYVGLEPDPESFEAARARIEPGGVVLPLREEDYDSEDRFDVVCALEVLEHIRDDLGALRRWRRRLASGGCLIVSVPAGRERFGPSDTRQGHIRRYDREDLRRTLRDAGFQQVDLVSYGFPLGYALHAVSHARARREAHATSLAERTTSSGRWMQPSRGAARLAVAAPFALIQRPFAPTRLGTGLVARAHVGPMVIDPGSEPKQPHP